MTPLNDDRIRILIAEWIPSFNKGELAIFQGILKTFETLGKVDVSIFSFYPSLDRERYPKNVKIIDIGSDLYLKSNQLEKLMCIRYIYMFFALIQHLLFILLYKILGKHTLRFMNKSIWREYLKSDIIIICHDQVSCVLGCVIGLSPVYITLLAKVLQKPTVIYGNGNSGFNWKIEEVFASYVLNNADLITMRDEESYLYLKEFVRNKTRIHHTACPAVLLTPANPVKVKEIINKEKININDGMLVGVSLTHKLLSSAFKEPSNKSIRYNKAIIEIARTFDRLIETFQSTIIFIPHCIEPYNNRDDRTVARKVYNNIKNKKKVILINEEYSAETLKGLMGTFDIFISARIHAAIGALSMGVPSLIFTKPGDKRASGLIGKMMRQEEWVYNIEKLDNEQLFIKISKLICASNNIRKDLPSINKDVEKKAILNGILLKDVLSR